jgi:hypothetical protein
MFLENEREIIKEKRVKTRNKEIRRGYWPNSSPNYYAAPNWGPVGQARAT